MDEEEISMKELLETDRLQQYNTPSLRGLLVRAAMTVVRGRHILSQIPIQAVVDPLIQATMQGMAELEDQLIPAIRRELKRRGE